MDIVPNRIIETIKELIAELKQNQINLTNAVLFGSYAKGNYNEYSDIDVALISESFSGNRFLDKELIRKYIVSINTDISPVPFRPEDFNKKNLFANQIIKEGIEISVI